MAEFNDDTIALNYVKEKGYVSYSSMKLVRDCSEPYKMSAEWFDVGTAVHSLLLEHKLDKKLRKRLTPYQMWEVKKMLAALARNKVVCALLKGSINEDKFLVSINGCPVLGYIDINSSAIGDLKTTKHSKMTQFISAMDFLQAAVYRRATGKKDFIYIGISKATYEVFTFNVNEYPLRMLAADKELDKLTKYIASKVKFTPLKKAA